MGRSLRWMLGTAVVANALSIAAAQTAEMRGGALDNGRIIDGNGAAPIENGRISIERGLITRVARDSDQARRDAEMLVQPEPSALKISSRLPFASPNAVIDVCEAHRIPCTAHLELLDPRELIPAGLHGIEHVKSCGISLVPRIE